MGKNGILAMSTDKLYEVDGVVFDEDSYARYLQHCEPAPAPTEAAADEPEAPQETAPSFTFYTEPQHVGWYPDEAERSRVPMMSGALPPEIGQEPPAPAYFLAPVRLIEEIRTPVGQCETRTLVYGGGSGSGSYMTSFTTSFVTSYRYGSGSGSFFSSGSCIFAADGYGLELI